MTPEEAFGRSLWKVVKHNNAKALAGWIAEAEVFEQLNTAGVPCVRCMIPEARMLSLNLIIRGF